MRGSSFSPSEAASLPGVHRNAESPPLAIAGTFADAAALALGLTTSTGVMIAFFDRMQRIGWVNERFAEWFGVAPGALVGRTLHDVYGAQAFAAAKPRLLAALGGEHIRYERLLEKPGSTPRWISISLHPHRGPEGDVLGVFACSIEVDELRRTRDALDLSLQETAIYLENSPLAVIEWDRDGRIRRWAGQAERVFGRRSTAVMGRTAAEIGLDHLDWAGAMTEALDALREGRSTRNQVRCRSLHASGQVIDCEWFHSAFVDRQGMTRGILSLVEDITARAAAEAQLRHAAVHDGLTGCHNRRHLVHRIELAIAQAQRQGGTVALLFLDLDRFKPVNDRYGHAVGDALLKAVAGRLRSGARDADCIARIGGDEFAILLAPSSAAALATTVGDRVARHLAEPFHVHDQTVSIGVSVGIARFPDDGRTADELLRHADERMYDGKRRR